MLVGLAVYATAADEGKAAPAAPADNAVTTDAA